MPLHANNIVKNDMNCTSKKFKKFSGKFTKAKRTAPTGIHTNKRKAITKTLNPLTVCGACSTRLLANKGLCTIAGSLLRE